MYTTLTPTFMYSVALVRCLPVHVLGLTFTLLSFSEMTVKYTPVGCAVILFSWSWVCYDPDHSVTWLEISVRYRQPFSSVAL